jgi:OFA family oxalate/formate antiporter-like MFS transporter
MNQDEKHRFFYGYIIVAASLLLVAFSGGTWGSFGVFANCLITEFGWSRAMTSSAHSLCVLLFGIFGIVAGRLGDRFGPRVLLSVGGLLMGLGYILMSQISTIWQVYLFYGVMVGIGLSPTFVLPMSTTAKWFMKKRGMVTGIVLVGSGLLQVIWPPVVAWLISKYEWRNSYIIFGIITLVFLTGAAQFMRRDPGEMGQLPYGAGDVKKNAKDQSPNSKVGGFSLQQAIRTNQFWLLFIVLLCFGVFLQTITAHLVLYTIDLGNSPTIAATILAVFGGLKTAGMLIGGSLSDKIGIKQSLIIALILMLVASLCLLIAKSLWMLYLFSICIPMDCL